MDKSNHTLACLFEQLGIENNRDNIADFIIQHHGIPRQVSLDKADIWTSTQSEFLRDSLNQNSDWAEIVDMLDALLR